MITTNLKKGKLLIAEPSLISDLSFNRSVVLLTDYNSDGSIGFIINKPLKYTIKDLVPDVNARFTIYNGGPIEQDNLYFIHNVPELITNSIEISYGIYWGGNFELARTLINEGKIKNDNIRFFLGYTGWEADQLENEMYSNQWIITDNLYKNKIIGKSATDFWKKEIIEIGGNYMIWANAPENPIYN